MASSSSSSSMEKNCVNCFSHSDILRAGWRLHDGGFATLCNKCASAYEDGSFCNTFHLHEDGWRYCDTCKKDLHCGCIMSIHTYSELDCGGVKCTPCMANDVSMFQGKSSNVSPQTLDEVQDHLKVIQYVETGHMMKGSTQGMPSLEQPSTYLLAVRPFENPGDSEEFQGDALGRIQSLGRYTLKPSEEDLCEIKREYSNSVVIPLFEKSLTSSDANSRNGRLVIPKKCAEGCLPRLLKPEGIPIIFQDTNGNDWEFKYRFWPNSKSKMYVLEGVKDYLLFYKCEAGDKVSFYRIEPQGKLVMALKKANTTSETAIQLLEWHP